jgi:hypothetical protein
MGSSILKNVTKSGYILFGVFLLVMVILFVQPVNAVAFNLMADPTVMIIMLVAAGIAVITLFGSSFIKGTFMNSEGGKYFKYIMMLVMVVVSVLAFISFTTYGSIVIIISFVVAGASLIALFFQHKSMF